MKRLTRRMCGGWGVMPGYELNTLKGMKAVVDRLAAYEDTGLEPDEANKMAKEWTTYETALSYVEELGGLDHLRELAQAKAQRAAGGARAERGEQHDD